MTRTSNQRIAAAAGALAALLLSATLPARAHDADALAAQRTRAALEAALGAVPERCVASREGLELCQWSLGSRDAAWKALARSIDTDSRVNVLCELPADGGARAPGSCSVHPRRSDTDPWTLPNPRPTKNSTRSLADRRAARERLQRRADAMLGQARTLLEISLLIGQAPDQCVSPQPGVRTCLWRATSHTQGHAMLAATIDAPRRKKLRLECRLPADASPRAPDSCRVEVGA